MQETREHLPIEDMVLKTAAQYFADELFPFLGIREKAAVAAPTEQVYLEAKDFYEDFNYVVRKGEWIHLEFESDNVTKEDLKRFRCYEAVTGYTYHVSVTTYVICSSKVKKVLSQLKCGVNTYRVIPIRLKDKNADQLFQDAMQKKTQGIHLEKKDLVPLLLATLMSGKMTQKERIIQGCQLIQESESLDQEEETKMLTVLYALANKFLNDEDLKKVREVSFMTRFAQLFYNDGLADGMEKGMEKGIEKGIEKGTQRVNQLAARLLKENRDSDLLRSLEDPEFQEQLFKEYQL